ncbi:MAG: EamA family transporter [Clostridia bacterium]|nr:EamA family transporter [Clostridia bacterium]
MTALMVALLVFLFSLQSLFLKLFSERYDNPDSALTSTVFSITYGVFAGVATLILAGFRFAPSPATLGLGALNAVMLFTYTAAMIQASRCGSYSFQMISVLFGGILVPMIYGALFLGEALTALQLAAVALMLVSFVLMNLRGLTLRGNSNKFLFWCLALFLSNGFYGVFMNLQQMRMNGGERNEMIILTFLGMALLYAVLQLARSPKALVSGFRMSKKPMLFLILCCCVATAAVHMMLYVLTLIDETVLYTIDNGGVLILSVLYSRLLFHEKLSRTQLLGIALAVASIVMLSL